MELRSLDNDLGMQMQLLEELREKQKQEVKLLEELEGLKGILRSEKQNLMEVSSDRDKLRSLCDQKDFALQVLGYAFEISFPIVAHFYLVRSVLVLIGCFIGETEHGSDVGDA